MKTKWTTLLAATALSLALAAPTVTVAQSGQAGGPPAKRAGMRKGGERHPEIREAIRQLRHAKETLARDAAHDFDGHRKAAIEHIEQAQGELEKALQSDKQ